ncbi:IPP transferase-domain-containing protein [Melampsora americana]|nr:IPP transferase-domain-containing protein [Melampsora americana]
MKPDPKNLVVIVGTTGTGKSQLGIQLSNNLCSSKGLSQAEIINGDSMQVYKGLDVLTNKVSPSEMMDVPHHLISFLDIDEDYTVERFRNDAIKTAQEIHDRGRLPIVVGGTGYYIQNLIMPGRLSKDASSTTTGLEKDIRALQSVDFPPLSQLTRPYILDDFIQRKFPLTLVEDFNKLPTDILQLCFLAPSLPPFSSPKAFPPHFPTHCLPPSFQPPNATAEDFSLALYNALRVIDPEMSERWHWRDLRKVRRSVEVPVCTGKKMSAVVAEQDQRDNAVGETDPPNRPPYRTLVFWLYAELNELGPRLDDRVDEMLKKGLLDEVQYLRNKKLQSQHAMDPVTDVSRGPYQAIGYREFEACGRETLEELSDSEKSKFKINTATELMKISTRQYAKSQVKWMQHKFLPEVNKLKSKSKSELELYVLDATDLTRWRENVFLPAQRILQGTMPSNFIVNCFWY